jgi:hypothetical protein
MNPKGTLYPLVERIRGRALIVGGGAAALGLVGAFFDRQAFDRAYMFSYIFILGLALGSMALLMIHRQLGGAWGFLIRRPLEAGALTIPLMAVLFIPVLIDLERIYPWVNHPVGTESEHAGGVSEPSPAKKAVEEGGAVKVTSSEPVSLDPAGKLQQYVDSQDATFKQRWLNPAAFTVRVAIYFALWITLALVLAIGSIRQDKTGSTDLAYGLNGLSGVGLVIYFLSVSFAVIDFGMSLEPAWYSTLYGVLLIIGQGISTIAFMILVAAIISRRGEVEGLDKPETFNDLGNLLLAFTMLWGYLSFSQFLIIWAGNLAEEIPWYMRRLHGGWENIGRFLILFHFAVPFLVLLARPLKRNISALWKIAALVLFAHLIDDFWLIAASTAFDPAVTAAEIHANPSLNPGWFRVTWLDFVIPVAMGGLWLSAFLWFLKSRPLMVAHDPQLLPALKQASGGH